MSKSDCVFTEKTKNDFIVNFVHTMKPLLNDNNKDIVYVGVILVDQLCKDARPIPKYTGSDVNYKNPTSEVYHPAYKKNLSKKFNKIMTNLSDAGLEAINKILVQKIKPEYKTTPVIITKENDDNLLFVAKTKHSFPDPPTKIFDEILKAGITEETKKKIKESFQEHYELIKSLNKDGQKYYLLFYPINYKFIIDQTLIYVTFVGKTDNIEVFWQQQDNIIEKYIAIVRKNLISDLLLAQIAFISSRLYNHSIKSAIAAIMSRNGSHNIGSHVLAAVGTNSIDLPDDQILFKYIQHRMDYIAQITTEIPGWTYSSLFVQDIMRRFYMQRHLLNNIAKSEGLEAYEYQKRNPNGKVAKNKWGDGIEGKLIIKVKKSGSEKYFISPYGKIEKKLDALSLAIPGGVIGQHAFFTIMENIIRNSAKHEWSGDSSKRTQKNLEITIEYEDNLEKDFVVFKIWDNVSDVFMNTGIEDINKADLAIELLPDDSTKQCMDSTKLDVLPLHQRLNCYLSKSFVDQETGKLLQENWGLAEMKISAGYLNKRSLVDIGKDGSEVLFEIKQKDEQRESESIDLIRAIGIEDKSKDKVVYRLGFEFAVPKPKELLIIGKGKGLSGEEKQIEPIKEKKAGKKSVYFKETDPESLDYEFVLFQEDQCKKLQEDFEYWHYPHRLFCVCDNEQCDLRNKIIPIKKHVFQTFIKEEKWNDLKLFLYRRWIEKRYLEGNKKINLYVDTTVHSGSGGGTDKSALGIFLDYYKDEIYKKYLGGEKNNLSKKDFENFIAVELHGDPPTTNFEGFCNRLRKKARIDGDITNKIKERYCKYPGIVKDLMIKYDEYIETLPRCYISDDGNGSGKGLWKDITLFNNNKKINLIAKEDDESLANAKYKRHGEPEKNSEDSVFYHEALSGSQTYFSMLENPPEENYHKTKLALQLVENALATILIIDERAGNYYINSDSGVKTRFDRAGICIISEFNNKNNVHKVTERKIEKDDPFEKNKKYNYIIIHQGILDKLKPNEHCTVKEKNNYLVGFIDYLKNRCDLLIVTSGRGQPNQLKKGIGKNLKFLPFSNLESFILKPYHEKFLLVQVLDQLFRERKAK